MAKSKSTGSHIKTPIAPTVAVSDRIEQQRQRLFKAMNAVKVTALSLGEGDIARKETLEDAWQLMDSIAGELCGIGGAVMSAIVIPDEYGVSPKLQRDIGRAAKSIRAAIAALEYAPAPKGSDADMRFQDAIEHLQGALHEVLWTPPKEEQS